MKKFDLVLPVGVNEIPIINDVVSLVKENINGYNKIFLVTNDKNLSIDGCITIDENIFPFTKQDMINILGTSPRIGWIYQQLLKLYSVNIIENCLEDILILDSDVFILKKLSFIENDLPVFTVGYENTRQYHTHSEKLHPSITRIHKDYSGISHHMMLNRDNIKELFNLIEDYHKKPFFNVFLESIDAKFLHGSSCSEYEIYFNFMCRYHPNEMKIRELKWANVPHLTNEVINQYDYVSIPKWLKSR